ncbi:MAG: class II aldolase, partial [Rhodospirillaceae bacterium]|nr:class II aldolase [Rhodospirillaceae bacterium]
MAVQDVSSGSDVRSMVSEEEWQTRIDLAVAYRLISH